MTIEYQYSITNDTASGSLCQDLLDAALSADSTIGNLYDGLRTDNDNLYIIFTSDLGANKSIADSIVNTHDFNILSKNKEDRIKAIDKKTDSLIEAGFEYPPSSGIIHSASQESQLSISGVHQMRDDPAMTYPIRFNSKDDLSYYDVTSSTDIHNMALTAFGHVKGCIDSGTTLKDQIRAATNQAELDAIVDNR